MSLPKSLGDPAVSANQLLAESLAVKDPFGIQTMQIHPATYTAIAGDIDVLKATLRDDIRAFFAGVAKGDAARETELNAVVFKGDEFGKAYILSCTKNSASNPDYTDAHALSVQTQPGVSAPLAGLIIMPRAQHPFAASAEGATGVPKGQFADAPAPPAQMNFMTVWHEFSHTTGADEAQADTMAAIITRKAFGTAPLQAYADMRALDSLLTFDKPPFEYPDPDKPGQMKKAPPRHEIYGWRTAEAVDAVINMPEKELRALDEKGIAAFSKKEFANPHYDALCRVGHALREKDPDILKPETANLKHIGEELQTLLKSGKFDGDPGAQAVARRSLLAISRVAIDPPEIDINLGVTASRIMSQKAEAPAPVQKQALKAPAL